jgi:tetratricopeptide (TPR) repeat protein
LELGRALKQAGNFSAATTVLEEALKLSPDHPGSLVELGECRQHLRQFEEALDCYLKAGSYAVETGDKDIQLLARYRAGVLAQAMGKRELARAQFEAVSAISSDFRDAGERLAQLDSRSECSAPEDRAAEIESS